MNRNFIPIYSIFICLLLNSCSHKDTTTPNPLQDGNWVNLIPFGGVPRTGAISFVIGNYAYIGTGLDQQQNRYNDLWRFDPVKMIWYQVAENANMSPRNLAVAFTINGKGYVGSGFDSANALSDFWQYDPVTNGWSRVASMGDTGSGPQARYSAVAFGIDAAGYGYVGTGNDGMNYHNDFWQFTPPVSSTDTGSWHKIIDLPGAARTQAVSWVYNNKGYVVTGIGAGGTLCNDFFYYDPTQQSSAVWKELRHITNYSPESYDNGYTSIVRSGAVGFVMLNTKSDGGGDRGYITTGLGQGSLTNTTWAYNFATDLWNEKTSYERAVRSGAIGFAVNNLGFAGLGNNGATIYSNIDEWFPDESYNSKD